MLYNVIPTYRQLKQSFQVYQIRGGSGAPPSDSPALIPSKLQGLARNGIFTDIPKEVCVTFSKASCLFAPPPLFPKTPF